MYILNSLPLFLQSFYVRNDISLMWCHWSDSQVIPNVYSFPCAYDGAFIWCEKHFGCSLWMANENLLQEHMFCWFTCYSNSLRLHIIYVYKHAHVCAYTYIHTYTILSNLPFPAVCGKIDLPQSTCNCGSIILATFPPMPLTQHLCWLGGGEIMSWYCTYDIQMTKKICCNTAKCNGMNS